MLTVVPRSLLNEMRIRPESIFLIQTRIHGVANSPLLVDGGILLTSLVFVVNVPGQSFKLSSIVLLAPCMIKSHSLLHNILVGTPYGRTVTPTPQTFLNKCQHVIQESSHHFLVNCRDYIHGDLSQEAPHRDLLSRHSAPTAHCRHGHSLYLVPCISCRRPGKAASRVTMEHHHSA